RIAALDVVSSLHMESAADEIRRLIREDVSPDVRTASLGALAKMEADGIEEAVFSALEDEEPSVRMNALGEIPALNLSEESVVGLMEPVIENGTIPERQAALDVLAGIDHPLGFDLLEQLLDR